MGDFWRFLQVADEELFLFLNRLGKPAYDPFWQFITEPRVWIPLYVLLLLALLVKLKARKMVVAVVIIAATVFATDSGSVHLLKNKVQRLRPCHQEQLQDKMRLAADHCGARYGFVSSHAANTFGIAVLVGSMLRPFMPLVPFILMVWASFSAYSRVYLGVHFPLDIVCGALYGGIIGWIMFVIYRKVVLKLNL